MYEKFFNRVIIVIKFFNGTEPMKSKIEHREPILVTFSFLNTPKLDYWSKTIIFSTIIAMRIILRNCRWKKALKDSENGPMSKNRPVLYKAVNLKPVIYWFKISNPLFGHK